MPRKMDLFKQHLNQNYTSQKFIISQGNPLDSPEDFIANKLLSLKYDFVIKYGMVPVDGAPPPSSQCSDDSRPFGKS